MPSIYGKNLTKSQLEMYAGGSTANIGVTSITLNDGPAKGLQALEIKNAAGLFVRVISDRCMDISDVEFRGVPIGWHSPAPLQRPDLHTFDKDNFGWQKSFSGFILTCGLDHAFGPEEDEIKDYAYPGRQKNFYPMHGRVGMIPAQLED